MARGSWGAVVRQFDRLSRFGTTGGLDESQLLDRFLARKDEAAFEAIVQRYGPMVLSVCRDLIPNPHDADDAFQATFLVLVRRAGDLRRREQLGSWLHGVARRVAMRARAVSYRNKERVRAWDDATEPASPAPARGVGEELRPLIREEVDRLPAHYRDAVILCYFEGRTHEEAAERLGWPLGTVKGRLARAREQLRTRLERRGVDAAPLSVGLALSTGRAAVPALLQSRTVAAALAYLEVGPGPVITTTIISGAVLELAQGALKSMTFGLTKIGLFGAISIGMVAIPAVLASQATREVKASKPSASVAPAAASTAAAAPNSSQPNTKAVATSPAEGLVTRPASAASPTSRPAATTAGTNPATPQDLLREALNVYKAADSLNLEGRIQTSEMIRWSLKITEAEVATSNDKKGRVTAFENQVVRMKRLASFKASELEVGKATGFDAQSARFAQTESEGWLQEAKQSPNGLPATWNSRTPTPASDRAALPTTSASMPGMGFGSMGMGAGVGVGGPPPASGAGSGVAADSTPRGGVGTRAATAPRIPAGAIMTSPTTGIAPPESLEPSARIPSTPIPIEGGGGLSTRPTRKPNGGGIMAGGMLSNGSMGGGMGDGGMMGGGMGGGQMGLTAPGTPTDPESEKLSGVIRKQLDDVVSMNFPNETPLEDVLKHIKASTSKDKGGLAKGIPIYLDPIGLSEVDKTPTSTISLDLEGVPLRTTLRLALDQLGLAYKVHDGVLIISTPDRVEQLTQP